MSLSIQSLVEAYQAVYNVEVIDEKWQRPNVGKVEKQAQRHRDFALGKGSDTAFKRGPRGEDPSTMAIRRSNKMGEVMASPKFDRYQPAKKQVTKEEVIQYLMDEGFVNNEVSAEVFIEHMSDEWLDAIIEGYKELPVGKMMRKTFKKGMKAASSDEVGDTKGWEKNVHQGAKIAAVASAHHSGLSQDKSNDNKKKGAK